jgi:3-oxoadipate enol-lactonase|tara:strand:+ start:11048 stop:11836 length:789 start_codon:yes stop_codon:yes gene_type:complete
MHILSREFGGLHWREDGDPNGVPLVFVNSLGTDLRLWDAVMPHLSHSHRIIRYDLRGHGLSDGPDGPYAMKGLAQDAAALMDTLDIQNALIVGCSIGGMIGKMLAATRPDLVGALMTCTSAARMGTPDMWQDRIAAVQQGGLAPVADGVMARWFSPAFQLRPEIALWRNMLRATSVDGYVGSCHALLAADLTEATAALTMPVLAVAGGEDLACPSDHVRAMVASIAGARYHEFAGVGHLPSVEVPDSLGRLISNFTKEVFHD